MDDVSIGGPMREEYDLSSLRKNVSARNVGENLFRGYQTSHSIDVNRISAGNPK